MATRTAEPSSGLRISKKTSDVAVDPVLVILSCGLFILKDPQIQFFWPVV